ncbi:type II toxin-antitoxin system prevent-host-death family antitoxin [Nonomuraea zeae]|uniref:Type II toxin-antitoxin system Phd/YefM family antitoxin n=1 Tax=Nonomuraea zeae TaxID=1642303 RepID=A0A5S4GDE2_9ACTN|nr:type II toxin-antitoxin system prevent-host-death family antitoxin [Nonomuraea zeae]TMR30782.1 type II toxin-antitoxin system Phd/YefM family antitoxin [Nonomuraea zeae]
MINTDRAAHDELQARFGPPLGVEDARARWGSLIGAAGDGTITLITRERWEWAALVPLSEVSGVLSGLPTVSLSTARSKLGDLVRQAAQPYEDLPVLLTRHRTPVAALVAARRLLARPAPARRPSADALVAGGHTITLARDSVGMLITAIARDDAGAEVATGYGADIAEALIALSLPRDA